MKGKKPIEDLNAGVRSAIRVEIYWLADEILKVDGKQNRRGVLDALPEMIRPHIESEVRRLWEMRRQHDET
jgi:hypothetical protein